MPRSDVYLLTSNRGKILAAQSAFSRFDMGLKLLDREYEEIQADTSAEIARFTALQAVKELNLPVIREDHSLVLNALGIPGPYTKFVEQKLSPERLVRILDLLGDRTGYFELSAAYAHPDGDLREHSFRVQIKVAKELRGPASKGWNSVLMLADESRVFAEYPEEERTPVWERNFVEIAKYPSGD